VILLTDGEVVAITVVKQTNYSWLESETASTLPAKQRSDFGPVYPHTHIQSHSSADKW